ncbi:thiopeptide-type bacteriocin biosynthesis protein [Chryseobacterium sp. PBS4-4]|uniref:Thiopeptide-type bacteriocin biosynthesis protein n=1 Tax=Chryseobacterium edaphi TaxID=2976532 RepID=A0ABT2W5C6_9FLAO|nr:thiopeptide-type bacteriocin biosynthesis protein [Chryseobacterium edaphi]MCU7617411.1 thiopeptide-type bacteriocin biosynthesis protein [Chryseobacterium edaphi]
MTNKRKFIPGDEWLYLKVYAGITTADIILEEAIQSLAEYFQENNYISKWFFIRYHDPKPHLRIRFFLNQSKDYLTVLNKITNELQEFTNNGEISNILAETYSKEIERYGQSTIEDAETLFHKNSEFTLLCLPYDDEDKLIFSIFYINEILNNLNLDIQEKLVWIKNFNDCFKEEFNANKNLNSQLDKKYRAFKPKLMNFMYSDEFSDERNAIILHIEECDTVLKQVLQRSQKQSLEVALQSFFQSIFHMNINRLFVSNQRLFEMIIYDYLVRYYKSLAFYNLHEKA